MQKKKGLDTGADMDSEVNITVRAKIKLKILEMCEKIGRKHEDRSIRCNQREHTTLNT